MLMSEIFRLLAHMCPCLLACGAVSQADVECSMSCGFTILLGPHLKEYAEMLRLTNHCSTDAVKTHSVAFPAGLALPASNDLRPTAVHLSKQTLLTFAANLAGQANLPHTIGQDNDQLSMMQGCKPA